MARPTKPKPPACFDCGQPTPGTLLCGCCACKTAPFRTLAEPDKPRAGGDRRRKGGPHGKD